MSASSQNSSPEPRRTFVARLHSWLMLGGLAAGYGTFASYIGRFLFPNRGAPTSWQFVMDLESFPMGRGMTYVSPAGQRVVISRTGESGQAEDFIALSSVCPHLGCQVHWEGANNRFFCPCHNGAFDAAGQPLAGPPKDANQSLAKYPLLVEHGLLYIQVNTQPLV